MMSTRLEPSCLLPLSYTGGASLEPLKHPEIAIIGLPHKVAYGMLEAIFEAVAAGARFKAGDETDELARNVHDGRALRIAFTPVAARYRKQMLLAEELCPNGFDALQAVYSDPSDVLPWEDGYDVRCAQLLLDG